MAKETNHKHKQPRALNRLLHQEMADEINDDVSTGTFPQVKKKPARSIRKGTGRGRILTTLLVIILCALLGFGYVTQIQNSQSSYATLSEDELVRLLDETSAQVDTLEQQKTQLSEQLRSIKSAADKQKEVERVAKENEESSGILSGRLPAEGKGVVITVGQRSGHIPASMMFTLIEELRNAGAEVMEFNGVRVVTSTSFTDTESGVSCSGQSVTPPYTIKAIGDPSALQNAIQIAGGVGSQLRVKHGAAVSVVQSDSVQINAVRQSTDYKYARTVE
ncbi:DUF881 domain-containing protein [Bifidobacterium sp. 82T24]|uniref:DUF881 domain-containing protein n=1 Tax=Bifidobacterium pluvialisilvae TaxID=2834436 RepID=UPI001C59CD47|nr:DUF881 domain-containing protein [Bifidobacterium pluvialisilvae]MBW3089078.1 DUF881 domain-containing protein [Bifidobacterium pluvialisilvae]